MVTRRLYISGPMNGYPERNFPAFTAAEDWLIQRGWSVLLPHTITHPDDASWHDFLRRDVQLMLAHCSGLVLLPGWPKSKGARLELATALALEWPVLYFDGVDLHEMNSAAVGMPSTW